MRISKRIGIWIRVLRAHLLTFGGVPAEIWGPEETVAELLKKRSLLRFGDGEFGIYRGKDIHYQPWSPALQKAFEEIKDEYEKDSEGCPYLLAMQKCFMTVNGFQLMKKRVYVSSWAESRLDFKKHFRRDIPYGEGLLFDPKNRQIYAQLWRSPECPHNVIFIHNNSQYAERFASTYQKNVAFVQCPARDAFSVVEDLEKEVLETVKAKGWTTNDVMLTISAGPAGKVLVHHLSKCGFWCIDAGHCWDDPIEGI